MACEQVLALGATLCDPRDSEGPGIWGHDLPPKSGQRTLLVTGVGSWRGSSSGCTNPCGCYCHIQIWLMRETWGLDLTCGQSEFDTPATENCWHQFRDWYHGRIHFNWAVKLWSLPKYRWPQGTAVTAEQSEACLLSVSHNTWWAASSTLVPRLSVNMATHSCHADCEHVRSEMRNSLFSVLQPCEDNPGNNAPC